MIGRYQFLVVAKIYWIIMRYKIKAEEKVKVVKWIELLNERAEKYGELIEEDWRARRMRSVESVENEWERFKGASLRIS